MGFCNRTHPFDVISFCNAFEDTQSRPCPPSCFGGVAIAATKGTESTALERRAAESENRMMIEIPQLDEKQSQKSAQIMRGLPSVINNSLPSPSSLPSHSKHHKTLPFCLSPSMLSPQSHADRRSSCQNSHFTTQGP